MAIMAGLGIIIPRNGGGGTPVEIWSAHTSDDFTGSGTPHNRTLNNALGGSATVVWQVTAAQSAQFGLNSGVLGVGTTDTQAALCVVNAPSASYRVTTKVTALPTSNNVGIALRRTLLSGGTDYRLSISPTGVLSSSGFTTSGLMITNGSTLSFGVDNPAGGTDRIRVWINGSLVLETNGTLALSSAGMAGYSRSAINGAFSFDDFKLELAS